MDAEERKEQEEYVNMKSVVYPATAGAILGGFEIHCCYDDCHQQKLIPLAHNSCPKTFPRTVRFRRPAEFVDLPDSVYDCQQESDSKNNQQNASDENVVIPKGDQ